MKKHLKAYICIYLLLAFSSCNGSSGGSGNGGGGSGGDDSSLAGGDTTSDDRTSLAFENPASNLDDQGLTQHALGDGAFGSRFVAGDAPVNGGLGPVFSNVSCEGCHVKNGRGRPIFNTGSSGSQAVIKVSQPGFAPELPGGPPSSAAFGSQIQDQAIFGVAPEARINLTWTEIQETYPDGTKVGLRRPNISFRNAVGSTNGLSFSFRSAPPVFGAGLLEAIPDESILASQDPGDANGDGISGRANLTYEVATKNTRVGKFGRKANSATLLQQTASAYFGDMGIGNSLFNAGTIELDDSILNDAVFYVQTIAVPRSSTHTNPTAQEGKVLFNSLACSTCHTEKQNTGPHAVSELSNQTIFPFTDLLLHDMGPGLADGRSDFQADGSEWKTPALWGIGISATILSSSATYLHDSRARTLEEAILWHGGEAEKSKNDFKNLPQDQRVKLIRFLESL